jgi:hypothetical protein
MKFLTALATIAIVSLTATSAQAAKLNLEKAEPINVQSMVELAKKDLVNSLKVTAPANGVKVKAITPVVLAQVAIEENQKQLLAKLERQAD